MTITTIAWGWPQWAFLALMLLHLMFAGSQHGEPNIDKATGQPTKKNGFIAFTRVAVMLFVLAAGGFFA